MKISLDSHLKIDLTPIQKEDQPTLYSLMDEVYRASYRYIWTDGGNWYISLIYNPQTVYKELKRSTSNYFFVQVGGENIGILKYDYPFSPKEFEIPNSMKLHRLYLHPDYHGKGIAKILMVHCESVARQTGLSSIWLEVMSCQPQAKKFYQKMGFEPVSGYQLDFERILPPYRGIEIWKKDVGVT